MSFTRKQLLVVATGGLICALIFGVRQSMSLFMSAINTSTGLGVASVSLAFACAQLMWGVTQPIAGALADKHGSARVIATGALLIAIGTMLTPHATSQWMLILTIGVISAGGAGMGGLGVLMAAVSRTLPADKRGVASGIINAGGSFGQFAVIPLAQFLSGAIGWVGAVTSLGFLSLAILPMVLVLRGKSVAAEPQAGAAPEKSLKQALRAAVGDRSYVLLASGFFVCGFHVAFIATHLPGVVASCGLPPEVGAWSLSLVGLFNIFGSFAAGWAVGRWRMKSILALLYTARAVAVLCFLLAPKNTATILILAVVIGFTYLATIPPTIGLVGKLHGVRYLATLFGLAMLVHQLGGFSGAWLGGRIFEATGSYDWVWYIDILLALAAALIHLPIREAHRNRPVIAPA
jgi:predicted MFS family arabinose efflux permease